MCQKYVNMLLMFQKYGKYFTDVSEVWQIYYWCVKSMVYMSLLCQKYGEYVTGVLEHVVRSMVNMLLMCQKYWNMCARSMVKYVTGVCQKYGKYVTDVSEVWQICYYSFGRLSKWLNKSKNAACKILIL